MEEFFREVQCHNNEELTKIARDMILYARKELKSIQELYPKSKDLDPIIEYYKSMILISTEFLVKTNQEIP